MEPLALMTEDMKEEFQSIPSQMRYDSRLVGLKQEDLEGWLTPTGRVAKNSVFMDAVRHDIGVLDPEHPLDDKTVRRYAHQISDYAQLKEKRKMGFHCYVKHEEHMSVTQFFRVSKEVDTLVKRLYLFFLAPHPEYGPGYTLKASEDNSVQVMDAGGQHVVTITCSPVHACTGVFLEMREEECNGSTWGSSYGAPAGVDANQVISIVAFDTFLRGVRRETPVTVESPGLSMSGTCVEIRREVEDYLYDVKVRRTARSVFH
jgi:hypothetical protein